MTIRTWEYKVLERSDQTLNWLWLPSRAKRSNSSLTDRLWSMLEAPRRLLLMVLKYRLEHHLANSILTLSITLLRFQQPLTILSSPNFRPLKSSPPYFTWILSTSIILCFTASYSRDKLNRGIINIWEVKVVMLSLLEWDSQGSSGLV